MTTLEIITIGDELLIGQVVDTNSAFIGAQFSAIGIPNTRITSIADRPREIAAEIRAAIKRSDVIIVTGGLGPTKDDITKHTLAEIFDSKLVRHQPTYDHVRTFIEKRGIEFNQSNQAQADVPQCCTVLKNEHGSAPGMMFEQNGHLLFSLPGVPFEMKALIIDQVIPQMQRHFKLQSVVHQTIMTYGLAESILSETIAPWEDALPKWLHLAYLPNPRAIRLRLSAYNVDKKVALSEINGQFELLRQLIPNAYLGPEPASIESSIAQILTERCQTLSVAESCTGGVISSRITALRGSSVYYIGGVTSYDNSVKTSILGVPTTEIEQHGAVSRQVVQAMAIGVRKIMGSHYSIATSGVAGPDGGTPEKPVGTVWIAIATPEGVFSQKLQLGTLRHENIERASSQALNMLRLYLLGEQPIAPGSTYL